MSEVIVRYTVDDDEVIQSTDGDWSLVETDVIGTSLWDYVRSETLRDIYRALFARARGGEDVAFEYRCDSFTHRRFMRMRIAKSGEGLTCESILLDAIPRDEPLPIVAASRGHNLVTRCSVCNTYGVGRDWVDVIDAVTASRLLADERPVRTIHGVCPSCIQSLRGLTA